MKLKDKVAFITGGTSGIGLESAKLFRTEGAKVVIVGSNSQRLEAAGKELAGDALLVQADVRKVADIERAVEQSRAKFGRIDIVFANAGASTVAPLEAVTPQYVEDNVKLNFSGTFFTIQKTAPLIPKGGSIIVTTSFLNVVGKPGLSILAATKAAARSLVRTLGAELAPRGIRVNAVCPAITETDMTAAGREDNQIREYLLRAHPAGRFANPEEIAAAVLYLASPGAAFTTGIALCVDGGFTV